MQLISEAYKRKIQNLAGIIPVGILLESVNLTAQEITTAYSKSGERHSFNADDMKKAIIEGRVVGILYKSEGMPVAKYRLILPVAMGTDKKGKIKIRAFHLKGQSENEAKRTGKRSAEVAEVWRMFNGDSTHMKSMWMTDVYFFENPPLFRTDGTDKHISSMMASFNAKEALNLYKKKKESEIKPIPTAEELPNKTK